MLSWRFTGAFSWVQSGVWVLSVTLVLRLCTLSFFVCFVCFFVFCLLLCFVVCCCVFLLLCVVGGVGFWFGVGLVFLLGVCINVCLYL